MSQAKANMLTFFYWKRKIEFSIKQIECRYYMTFLTSTAIKNKFNKLK